MSEEKTLFTLEQVVQATGGKVVKKGRSCIKAVCIDSRETEPDSLFVPLKGENVDGHQFMKQALAKGAGLCFVALDVWKEKRDIFFGFFKEKDASLIIVEDTLKALQDLAKYHMEDLPHVFRIGVTGSSGKTTTKEIIGAILALEANTIINKGNLNSDIGVPLSAFRVNTAHKYAVFEMGINHAGEMDIIADIVKPDYALITNIGTAHIGFLGTQEVIAREKKKICKHFNGKQTLFLYEDENYFDFLARGVKAKIVSYGPRSTRGYRESKDLGLDGTTINWEQFQIHYPLFGRHNLLNALGAITLTTCLGIDRENIQKGMEKVKPLFGRSELVKGDITIIKDYYNANPDSMEKALHFLHNLSWQGKKTAVLGSMLELGKDSARAHKELGSFISKLNLDYIFFFGADIKAAFQSCSEKGFKGICSWENNFNDLLENVLKTVNIGDLVLIKGSRSLALERLVAPLLMSFNGEKQNTDDE